MKNIFIGIAGGALCAVGAAGFFLDISYWGWWLVAGVCVIGSVHDSWS